MKRSDYPQFVHEAAYIGFACADVQRLQQWALPPGAGVHGWRTAGADVADVIFVHEDEVLASEGPLLKLRAASLAPLRTDWALRPVVIASRSHRRIPGCITFNPDRQHSLIQTARTLEARLAPLRDEHAVGMALALRPEACMRGVYHLIHDGWMVAVADLNRQTFSARPLVHATLLMQAQWQKRPDAAAVPPEGFVTWSMADALWTYLNRSGGDAPLPPLRGRKIRFAKLPSVPMERHRPLHAKLMTSL